MPECPALPELAPRWGDRPHWSPQREAARQAGLVARWAEARPGTPFPVPLAVCPVCPPLAAWLAGTAEAEQASRFRDGADAEAAAAAGPPDEGLVQLAQLAAAMARPARERGAGLAAVARRQDAEAVFESHHDLHVLLARELADLWADATGAPPAARAERARAALQDPIAAQALRAEDALQPFLAPGWDESDGRPVWREPPATGGVPERSKAFLLLHRWAFGPFRSATIGDFEPGRRGAGAGASRLRLYDHQGAVLELAGMTAGYEGEGPRGTLWALRAAGLPDGPRGPDGRAAHTALERVVFGERAFRWPPPPGERAGW